jgi:hypothetical protein
MCLKTYLILYTLYGKINCDFVLEQPTTFKNTSYVFEQQSKISKFTDIN